MKFKKKTFKCLYNALDMLFKDKKSCERLKQIYFLFQVDERQEKDQTRKY